MASVLMSSFGGGIFLRLLLRWLFEIRGEFFGLEFWSLVSSFGGRRSEMEGRRSVSFEGREDEVPGVGVAVRRVSEGNPRKDSGVEFCGGL